MSAISSFVSHSTTLIQPKLPPKHNISSQTQTHLHFPLTCNGSVFKFQKSKFMRVTAAVTAEDVIVTSTDEAVKRVYIGNIPRNLTNDELRRLVEEHAAADVVEVMYDKYSGRSRRFAFATMKTVEDANTVVEKLNDTEIGGRKIKVNITEKPLGGASVSVLQSEDTPFVDSPHKVYVGNLAKTVTSEMLKNFFSDKGTVLGAKVQRTPGTSKSSGFGFVSFSSDEEVDAAIEALNNAALEGQKIRVNKA